MAGIQRVVDWLEQCAATQTSRCALTQQQHASSTHGTQHRGEEEATARVLAIPQLTTIEVGKEQECVVTSALALV